MQNKILKLSHDCKEKINYNNLKLEIQDDCKVDLIVEENQKVNILNLLKENLNLNVTLNIILKSNATLYFNNIDISNSSNNFKINIFLDEKNALAYVNNVVIKNNVKSKYIIKLINKSPYTKGYINQRGVVKNDGDVILNAIGDIRKQASNSENLQESRLLLLSKAAGGEASPLLLIDNNDIVAGHKASVSNVDDEQLYYLQTRGITKRQGENLLTQAFIKPILDKIGLEEEEINKILEKGI